MSLDGSKAHFLGFCHSQGKFGAPRGLVEPESSQGVNESLLKTFRLLKSPEHTMYLNMAQKLIFWVFVTLRVVLGLRGVERNLPSESSQGVNKRLLKIFQLLRYPEDTVSASM